MAEKMTKLQWFKEIVKIVEDSEDKNKDGALEFLNKQITQLDERSKKAKEKAEQKRAEGDKLQAVVESVLSDELQSADEITSQVIAMIQATTPDGEEPIEATRAKVIHRMKNLIDDGRVEKGTVKEGARRVVGYRTI